MPKQNTSLLPDDMLQAAIKIKRYTRELDFISFAEDEKTVDAVVRNFEIIGEAANRINPDYRLKHTEIEWNRIRGFRNRIAHDYFGADNDIVRSIIETYLDGLTDRLETVIDKEKPYSPKLES